MQYICSTSWQNKKKKQTNTKLSFNTNSAITHLAFRGFPKLKTGSEIRKQAPSATSFTTSFQAPSPMQKLTLSLHWPSAISIPISSNSKANHQKTEVKKPTKRGKTKRVSFSCYHLPKRKLWICFASSWNQIQKNAKVACFPLSSILRLTTFHVRIRQYSWSWWAQERSLLASLCCFCCCCCWKLPLLLMGLLDLQASRLSPVLPGWVQWSQTMQASVEQDMKRVTALLVMKRGEFTQVQILYTTDELLRQSFAFCAASSFELKVSPSWNFIFFYIFSWYLCSWYPRFEYVLSINMPWAIYPEFHVKVLISSFE